MKNSNSKRIFIKMLAVALIGSLLVCLTGCKKEENTTNDIANAKNPVATMDVEYIDASGATKTGVIKIELDKTNAPNTVAMFVRLIQNGFYDGTTFNRIVNNFIIQGGYTSDGSKATMSDLDKSIVKGSEADYEFCIKGEFKKNGVDNNLKFTKGVIGVARADFSSYGLTEEGYNSGSVQFFIATKSNNNVSLSLNELYTSFGKVIEGLNVVEEIEALEVSTSSSGENSSPINKPVIKKCTVETYGVDYPMPETLKYSEIVNKVQTQIQYLYAMYAQQQSSQTNQ